MHKPHFTPLTPGDYSLSPQTVDIWYFSLVEPLEASHHILNQAEWTRALRYYFAKHQRRFATARTRVKQILALYLQKPAADLVFTLGGHGKPALLNALQLQFNVSHSGDHAVLAVGQQYPLGVDIECYSARPYLDLAAHLFSPAEQKTLASASIATRTCLFFQIWSEKEAFIKACGLGLSYPTQTISLPTGTPVSETIIDPRTQQQWHLVTFMPQTMLAGALCCHPSIQNLRYIDLEQACLTL